METVPPRRRRRIWPVSLGVFAVALIALLLLWDWNWFRPLVESRASAALGRPVSIAHFDLHLGRSPVAVLDGVEVANPDGFQGAPYLAHIDQVAVTLDAMAYLHGDGIVLTRIVVTHPDVDAIQHPDGSSNYQFATSGSSSGPGPKIGDLVITDGHAHVVDPKLRADFKLDIATREASGKTPPQIVASADGTYAGQKITGQLVAGALLSLRDAADPYPIDAHIENGPTKVSLAGTVEDPLHFAGTKLKLHLAGPDMELLMPLTGIALPKTPPYDIEGNLAYADRHIKFSDFQGRIGSSDIEGSITVDPAPARPVVEADLASKRVDLADLGGLIGSQPGRVDTPGQSAAQKAQVAKAEASSQLLPNTPINLPKLKAADIHLHYKGASIIGKNIPFDSLTMVADIVDGTVTLHPVQLGVGHGSIGGDVTLVPVANNDLHAKADIRFDHVDVGRMLAATGLVKGAGLMGGRFDIDSTGNSLSSLLGHGNGNVRLMMAGGDLSALILDLSGLEFGKAVLSALGLPNQAKLQCMAAEMNLKSGVLDSKTMLVVTSEADIVGSGTIDLAHEKLGYTVKTSSRHFSVGSLPTAIDIGGTFKDPSIRPEIGELAARGGAAIALGVLLTPLSALLATVQFGDGNKEENACAAVLHANGKEMTPQSTAAPPAAIPSHRARIRR